SKIRYLPGWNRAAQLDVPLRLHIPVLGRMPEKSGRILRWSHATNSRPVRPMWLTGRCLLQWQTHGVVCLRHTVNCRLGPQCGGALVRRLTGVPLVEKCPWRQRAATAWRDLFLAVLGFSASGQ